MSKLVVVHSISESKLRKSIQLGGMPLPSLAAMLPDNDFNRFGEITFILKPESVDPKDKKNLFYDRDIFSQRIPQLYYDIEKKSFTKFYNEINNFINENTNISGLFSMHDFDSLRRKPSEYIQDRIFSDNVVRFMFAKKYIKDFSIPMKKEKFKSDLSQDEEFKSYMISNYNNIEYNEQFSKIIKDSINRRYEHYKLILGDTVAKDITNIYSLSIFDQYGDFNRHSAELKNIIDDVKLYINPSVMTVDLEKLRSQLLDISSNNQLAYHDFVDELTNGVFINPHFKNGTKKIEFNLYNIEKYMLKQAVTSIEDTPDTSIGKISSTYAKKFSSYDEMLLAINKLDTMEDRHSSANIIHTKLFDIAEKLQPYSSYSRFSDVQDALSVSLQYVTDRDKLKRNLIREGFKQEIPEDIIDSIIDVSQDIKSLSNHYFEGKPQKTLYFEDFQAVLLPNKVSSDIVEALSGKVTIHFYDTQEDKNNIYHQYSFGEPPKKLKKLKNF